MGCRTFVYHDQARVSSSPLPWRWKYPTPPSTAVWIAVRRATPSELLPIALTWFAKMTCALVRSAKVKSGVGSPLEEPPLGPTWLDTVKAGVPSVPYVSATRVKVLEMMGLLAL